MVAPSQMFDNTLDAVKGWFHEAALDFSAKISSTATDINDPFPAGRVVHLDSSGNFAPGCIKSQMAIFLLQGSDDPDVANASFAGSGEWVAVSPIGTMSGLVATGAYELASTEFIDAVARTTNLYARNDLLRSVATGNLTAGRLDNEESAGVKVKVPWLGSVKTPVVGVVSRLVAANSHGKNVLHFWPVYLPGEN